MFSPATKGWIQKYLELFEQNQFDAPLDFEISQQHVHALFVEAGLTFGFASSFIFIKNEDKSRWTNEEQLKLLLFESILFLYISKIGLKNFKSSSFLEHLSKFYEAHSAYSIKKLFTFFLKETPIEKLETILAKRVGAPQNIIESTFEINSFSNTFIYLDLVLYAEYLGNNSNQYHDERYANLAKTALNVVILASKADQKLEEREKLIIKVFLESANLSREEEKEISAFLSATNDLTSVPMKADYSWLFKRYLLDLASLVLYSSNHIAKEEESFLKELSIHLGFQDEELNDSIVEVQRFVLQHIDKIHFLKDSSGVEKYYTGVSEKWTKILGRNKDKLAVELRQSKELVSLITKSTLQELSKEEKEKVKLQFKDLAKSVPALTIFLLPGGAVLLPIILKVIPSLVPSAFRDNELENKDSI